MGNKSREEQEYAQGVYQIEAGAAVAGQPIIYDQANNPAQHSGVDAQAI